MEIRPPRALWVPFMLGRPFGAPNQPEFQRAVLRALLALFEHRSGPVLEDFPWDAPPTDGDETFAAPSSRRRTGGDMDDPSDAMYREIAELAAWYDAARQRRGRTTVGVSGMTITDAAIFAASYLGPSPKPPAPETSAGVALKRACDDVKAYYYEAAAARPGNLAARPIDHWFWNETAAGKVFLTLQRACVNSADPSLRALGETALVPRSIRHAGPEGFMSPAPAGEAPR